MKSPNEFWLNLHRLADAYDAEGQTPDDRARNNLEQFRGMPAIAQWQVLADMVRLVANLPDLYPLVIAASNENHRKPGGQSNVA